MLCEGGRVPAASSKIPAACRSLGRLLYHVRDAHGFALLAEGRHCLWLGSPSTPGRSRLHLARERSPLPLARLPLNTGTLTASPCSRRVAIALARLPLNTRTLTASPCSRKVAIAFGSAPKYTTTKYFPINLLTNFKFSISIDLISHFQHV